MKKQSICVISGTRADYGLIKPVMAELKHHPKFHLQLIVTGAHLSPLFGLTVNEIEQDGFNIDVCVDMQLSGDTAAGITRSMGHAMLGFADAFQRLKPDLLLIVGDRYEMLAAASAALIAGIPIGHLYGGDITEGAYDDAIRHAMTKLSHLHFTTHEAARKRVIQLGEAPAKVFDVGAPALDNIKRLKHLSKEELAESLGIIFRETNLLITFHPVTRSDTPSLTQLDELLCALQWLSPETHTLIFTLPNADNDGLKLRDAIRSFADKQSNAHVFDSLGHTRYFNLMRHVQMVVGNSSSGIYEAPSFKIPTVNIGERQQGRIRASSVIDCVCEKKAISSAIEKAKTLDCAATVNPYGTGEATQHIIAVLEDVGDFSKLLRKKFYDL